MQITMAMNSRMKISLFYIVASCTSIEVATSFRTPDATKLTKYSAIVQLNAKRQAWNPFRFVAQSSKFIPIPFSKNSDVTVQPGDSIWAQGSAFNVVKFAPLDDIVMGGVSSSSFDDATGIWAGTVTDANNGGFIGIRSYPYVRWNMSKCRGLQIKIKSATNTRIKIGLRDTSDFNGIVWNSSTNIGNKPQVVRLPFSTLIPNVFANRIESEKEFDRSNVAGIQFVYSKFEYDGDLNPKFRIGDFNLQILEVIAY